MNQPNVLTIDIPRTIAKLVVAKFDTDPDRGTCEVDAATLSDAIALLKLQAIINEHALDLTPTEQALYRCLSLAVGHDVSFATLRDASGIRTKESLWVHIRRLRVKLMGTGEDLRTIRTYGYRLVKEEAANARNN